MKSNSIKNNKYNRQFIEVIIRYKESLKIFILLSNFILIY